MISLDRTLLGADYNGDALERHQEYAQKAGHLDIIVFSKKGFKKKDIDLNLTIYPTNSKLFYSIKALRVAREIIEQNKIDLIITQEPFFTGWVGWKIKRRFNIPLLIHFHGDFWQNKYWFWQRWWLNWFLLLISRFLVKRADGIRVVSSGIKDKLVRKGIDKNKIRVIPTPVDLRKFENYDSERISLLKEKYLKGKKLIINVGRNDSSKDYPTLLETAELIGNKLKNLAFWQIGAELDVNDSIFVSTGKMEQKDLINYYHAADVYLSSSCHESFGKVLIEAMVAGLPIVATATTGSKEIINEGENGFLVPIGDSQTLAKKTIYLLNNPEIAKRMGENGRRIAKEKFDKDINLQKIINFWKDLIHE